MGEGNEIAAAAAMEWGNYVSKRGGPDDAQELETAFALNRRNILAKIMYSGYDSLFFLWPL